MSKIKRYNLFWPFFRETKERRIFFAKFHPSETLLFGFIAEINLKIKMFQMEVLLNIAHQKVSSLFGMQIIQDSHSIYFILIFMKISNFVNNFH